MTQYTIFAEISKCYLRMKQFNFAEIVSFYLRISSFLGMGNGRDFLLQLLKLFQMVKMLVSIQEAGMSDMIVLDRLLVLLFEERDKSVPIELSKHQKE